MSLKRTREVADGRIFTASSPDLGLVDQTGYLDDALELARIQGGPGPPRVITYHRPGGYKPTIYSLLPELDMAGPQFLYLWWAGSI